MEDPLSFHRNQIYSLHLSADSSYQPDRDGYAEHVNSYGQRLKETARMLIRADWYILTKDNPEFKTIISSIKDVIENLSELGDDSRVNLSQVLDDLYHILYCLHCAGERAGENDVSIREVKHQEFTKCHKNLLLVAKLLVI